MLGTVFRGSPILGHFGQEMRRSVADSFSVHSCCRAVTEAMCRFVSAARAASKRLIVMRNSDTAASYAALESLEEVEKVVLPEN